MLTAASTSPASRGGTTSGTRMSRPTIRMVRRQRERSRSDEFIDD